MVRETTNTERFELFPEGQYKFTVVGKPEKIKTGKTSYRKWIFSYEGYNGNLRKVSFIIFPWESEELLLAVGGNKVKGGVDWDDDQVDGKVIEADVVHEADNRGTTRAKIKNVKEQIPF
jgi:hypothetical protein